MVSLSPTAKAILGMLHAGPRSGYEIKQKVDQSTRFFWAASYGQIYPELKRMEEAGLVTGSDEPTGGRQRTMFELTAEGRSALEEWLRGEPQLLEMRHEGMLMAFFADALPPSERADRLAAMRDQHLEKLEALRAVESEIDIDAESDASCLILRFGIEFNQWVAGWCDQAIEDLARGTREPSA